MFIVFLSTSVLLLPPTLPSLTSLAHLSSKYTFFPLSLSPTHPALTPTPLYLRNTPSTAAKANGANAWACVRTATLA